MSQTYPSPGDNYVNWLNYIDPPIDGVLYESDFVGSFNYHLFANVGTSGELTIEGSLDKVTWFPLAITLVDDRMTNIVNMHVHAGKAGFYKGQFPFFRVTGVNGAVSVGSHGWV